MVRSMGLGGGGDAGGADQGDDAGGGVVVAVRRWAVVGDCVGGVRRRATVAAWPDRR